MGLLPFITNYIPTSAASTGVIPPRLIGPLGAGSRDSTHRQLPPGPGRTLTQARRPVHHLIRVAAAEGPVRSATRSFVQTGSRSGSGSAPQRPTRRCLTPARLARSSCACHRATDGQLGACRLRPTTAGNRCGRRNLTVLAGDRWRSAALFSSDRQVEAVAGNHHRRPGKP
jgi:hypothetical protein